MSTNAAAPNLVGAGRALGLVIDKAGGWLQWRMNWWATRRGYGPFESAKVVIKVLEGAGDDRIFYHHWYENVTMRVYRPLTDEEKKIVQKKCKVLHRYTR